MKTQLTKRFSTAPSVGFPLVFFARGFTRFTLGGALQKRAVWPVNLQRNENENDHEILKTSGRLLREA